MRYLSNSHNVKVLELLVKGRQKSRWSFGWMREEEGQQLGKHGIGRDVWRHVESVDLVMEGL